jgi:hypothetical protein
MSKNCIECPSFLTTKEAREFWSAPDIQAPMCARLGYVLGVPGTDEADSGATEVYASRCDFHGRGCPSDPTPSWEPLLFTPKFDLLETDKSGRGDEVESCFDCSKLERLMTAKGEITYVCGGTGKVILASTVDREAASCGFKSPRDGKPITEVERDDYLPMFSATSVTVKKPRAKKKSTAKSAIGFVKAGVDYSSDAPVSEEHKGIIKAWRKIESPRGKVYYLPVFENSYFSEEDQEKIPREGDEHGDPSLYIDHGNLLLDFTIISYVRDLNLVLEGEPGSGKTEGGRFIAYVMNMPLTLLEYNEYSEPEEFKGLQQFDPSVGTYVKPGLLPVAWQKPGVIVSNEWNLAPEGIHQMYRSLNDSSRTLHVYDVGFKRHEYCFHLSTMNPAWDYRNIGAKTLASADTRRLSFKWMPEPDKEMMDTIVTETVKKVDGITLDKAVRRVILKIHDDLREMGKQGKLPDPWTLSQDVKVARLVEDYGLEAAYRRAYFDHVEPASAEIALSAIKHHIPYGSDWA